MTTQPYEGGAEIGFPTDKVASQVVPQGGVYTFRLLPGLYVLAARDATRAPNSFTSISLKAGQTLQADIPNVCM